MVNASFVFGMDDDDETVFERTVDWAVEQGIETATFHILTPYPGTALHDAHAAAGPHHLPQLGPVRHAPRRLPARPPDRQKRWRPATGGPTATSTAGAAIFQGAWTKPDLAGRLRHLAYAGGWKKFEPLWDLVIRLKRVSNFMPMLERLLEGKTDTRQAFAGQDIKLHSQLSGIAENVIE